MERPTYTREEMDAILRRALERQQAKNEGIAHEDLVAAAGEVGIPREEVEAAAREIAEGRTKSTRDTRPDRGERANRDDAEVDDPADDTERTRAIRKFYGNLISWACFSVVMLGLGFSQHTTWFVWPILGWGIALASQARRVFVERDYGGSRRERRRRRQEEKLRDFEKRVEVGADAILRVVEEVKRAAEARAQAEQAARGAMRANDPRDPRRMRVTVEPMTPTRVSDRPPPMKVEHDEDADPGEDGVGERPRASRARE